LQRLKTAVRRALEVAGAAFAPLFLAFGWVHQAAHILGQVELSGAAVRTQLGGLLGAMRRHRASVGELGSAVDHFLKVSRSYWPGLFACYDTADLPRTNNDLEQAFGSHRYHERRVSGRKGASPSLVLRGSAKLIAGLATRTREVDAADLAAADPVHWQRLRAELEERRQRRVQRRHFRHNPCGYLKDLENKLDQSRLPA
jgi:hypothetical protein